MSICVQTATKALSQSLQSSGQPDAEAVYNARYSQQQTLAAQVSCEQELVL